MDYGAIIFDDISLGKKEGWACKSPEFQPFRISVESIGNTAIWVTSATYEEFKALNIQNHVFLKIEAYLRTGVQQILRTFGASAMSADMHAYCVANVFYNMARYYYKFIAKPQHPGVTMNDLEIPLVDIRDGIRELYDMDFPVTPKARYAIEKSVVDYVKCEAPFVRFSNEQKSIGVWFPKLAHAKRVLSQPVPFSAETKDLKVPRSGVNARELPMFLRPIGWQGCSCFFRDRYLKNSMVLMSAIFSITRMSICVPVSPWPGINGLSVRTLVSYMMPAGAVMGISAMRPCIFIAYAGSSFPMCIVRYGNYDRADATAKSRHPLEEGDPCLLAD